MDKKNRKGRALNLTENQLENVLNILQMMQSGELSRLQNVYEFIPYICSAVGLAGFVIGVVGITMINRNNRPEPTKTIYRKHYSGNFQVSYSHQPLGSNLRVNEKVTINIPNGMRIKRDENGQVIKQSEYELNSNIREGIKKNFNHHKIDNLDYWPIEDLQPAFTLDHRSKMKQCIQEYEIQNAVEIDDNSNEIEYAEVV